MTKRTLTTVRCVPRFGYEGTEVRMVELDLHDTDDAAIRTALTRWFAQRGIADAVYDITLDEDGFFAVINDEAYAETWGDSLL